MKKETGTCAICEAENVKVERIVYLEVTAETKALDGVPYFTPQDVQEIDVCSKCKKHD